MSNALAWAGCAVAFAPANFDSPRFLLGGPGVNCFFFFGLIGFHGSVRLEMILLHFASYPLNDTPKPAGTAFYSLAH